MLPEIAKLKEHLSKKQNAAIAPPTDLGHHHAIGDHQKPSVGTVGGRQRNAIGAAVVHGPATVPSNPTPPTSNTAALGTDHGTKPLGGPQIETLGPPGPEGHGPAPITAGVMVKAATINGAGMGHPWLGGGVIGGPVKMVGVLNGATFHVRHP